MSKAVPKEGPRAPLFYGVLAIACGGLVHAQTVALSDLEACAGLETDERKLACFEAVVAARQDAVSTVAESVPESTDPPPAEPVSVESPAPESAAAPAAAETPAAVVAAEPQPAVMADTLPVSAEETRDTFGEEHLAREEPESPQVLRAAVAEVTRNSYGALVFHLDNGQVWRQIEPRYYPYPKNREFDVEITTGMMGEYRLQVEGAGRKVRIRRVK